MKTLLCVVLIAIVAQASGQQLRCFACDECASVDNNTPQRQCFSPATPPLAPSTPQTISLTSSTTTTTAPPNVAENVEQNVEGEDLIPSSMYDLFQQFRRNQVYSCFTTVRNIGGRSLVRRGCVLRGNDEMETCRNANYNEDPDNCQVCDTDECNIMFAGASTKAFASLFLVFSAFIISLRLN
ncbi:CLUMA_CG014205, isoform A [Clunio marinus]|uniref:CLUMA_CG014205, isoform A n=1 Tax=Clunio marinus TaxID=568069 RepID=A0A1J1ILL3_9DIPT|nr:CLUMA_CG014205, isoform A [Clunio marinus]